MATGTPATRVAQQAKIDYTLHEYVHDEHAEYGLEATRVLGIDAGRVFKTLVARTADDRHIVGIVPVAAQLDLKGLAAAVDAKSAEMARPADAQRLTGYVLGGISPLGQKRRLATVLDAERGGVPDRVRERRQARPRDRARTHRPGNVDRRDARGDRALVTDEPAIRIAVETDADDVLALWRAAGAVPSATDDAASIRALIAFDPGALLVAEIDDALVGSLIAGWDGWRGNMYRLAVHPEYRRRGIASVLVRAGEARLRALGCRRITALVVGDHESAVGLWTSAGYEWQTAQRRYTH